MPKNNALAKRDDSFDAVLERTNRDNPDPEDVKKLREYLDKDEAQAVVKANDPTRRAMLAILDRHSANDAVREIWKRSLNERRKALDYDESPLIVQLLIDQMLLSELRLSQLEVLHSHETNASHTPELGIYWEKRLGMTQRRFLKATETFAKVRKLLAEASYFEAKAEAKRQTNIKANSWNAAGCQTC